MDAPARLGLGVPGGSHDRRASCPSPVRFAPPPPGAPGADGAPQPLAAPAPPTQGSGESSPTNVQEAGVDEPDLVKTRGSQIFAVAAGRVHSVEAGQAPRLLGSIAVPGFGHELLLSGKRLLVLSHDYASTESARGASPEFIGGRPVAILTEVDVEDPGAMRILRTQRVGGALVSSRLNGETARVVVSSPARGLAEPTFGRGSPAGSDGPRCCATVRGGAPRGA